MSTRSPRVVYVWLISTAIFGLCLVQIAALNNRNVRVVSDDILLLEISGGSCFWDVSRPCESGPVRNLVSASRNG